MLNYLAVDEMSDSDEEVGTQVKTSKKRARQYYTLLEFSFTINKGTRVLKHVYNMCVQHVYNVGQNTIV